MPWSVQCQGTIEGVRQYLNSHRPYDMPHFGPAREFMLAQIDRIKTNGVTIQATGTEDAMRIEITSLALELEKSTRRPVAADAENPDDSVLTFAQDSMKGRDGAEARR